MYRPRKKDPAYCRHSSGQARVFLPDGPGGRQEVLLGKYDSPESWAESNRVIAEWKANGRRLLPKSAEPSAAGLSVNELLLAYWRFVEGCYVKEGQPTSEQETIRQALRFVRQLYGHTPAKEFGPLALKAVREEMVKHPITRKLKVKDPETGEVREETKLLRQGLARRYINKQIGRIKRLFAWAVEEELVPPSVYQALAC